MMGKLHPLPPTFNCCLTSNPNLHFVRSISLTSIKHFILTPFWTEIFILDGKSNGSILLYEKMLLLNPIKISFAKKALKLLNLTKNLKTFSGQISPPYPPSPASPSQLPPFPANALLALIPIWLLLHDEFG